MSKKHNWHGTIMWQRCYDCGEMVSVPFDPCDSPNVVAFLEEQQKRMDCKAKHNEWYDRVHKCSRCKS